MDAYLNYDRKALNRAIQFPNQINKEDIGAANGPMRARSCYAAWTDSGLVDTPIPELADVPNECLIDMPDERWADLSRGLKSLYRRLCAQRVGNSGASKVLYLKRPKLIALCDSKVKDVLKVRQTADKIDDVMELTKQVRAVGRQNARVIEEVSRCLSGIILEGAPIELSKARILDIILWSYGQKDYDRLHTVSPYFD
jgi:hypothetical protein